MTKSDADIDYTHRKIMEIHNSSKNERVRRPASQNAYVNTLAEVGGTSQTALISMMPCQQLLPFLHRECDIK